MSEQETHPPLALGKKQYGIIAQAIERWREGGTIDGQLAERLSNSIAVASFDWQRTARYAFIVSIFCLVIAVGAVLADEVLLALLKRIFNSPAIVKCGFFSLVATGVFRYGLYLRKRYPHRAYGNESVFFLGVLALAVAVFFLAWQSIPALGTTHCCF